ncbi:hypothetical protein INS49_013754 [Diaporthe citri]|uniref:uncharacterized protein n=1 Tax=Diaporthe citri TaxID=83186 RepID=UPI001C81AAD8|nr:uncharacterized protein INS49_013754 [Diaporthe citri]KAG6357871.1 hypothetical protein INS49_013754 [Diaporthe citri]
MAEYIHKYDEVCPSGVIINFAVDVLGQSRGPVACVLMNAAEVAIFHHELRKSTQAFPADRIAVLADKVAVLADPASFWADRDGKLWLMTYPQLSGILTAFPGCLEEDLALLMHMGCGQYTWDIVKACHDLWKCGQNMEVGFRKPVVQVFTIGTVRNLGTVLVLPVRLGLCFDRRVSQVVWRTNVSMSKAEVRYASRVACSPSGSLESHVVSVFTTVAGFKKLPPAPTNPPAFTGDFPAVLLFFCEHSYFDGGGNISPIALPKDEEMTDEYLRRLEVRGLTESQGGPPTNLGRITSWWHHGGVRNFDVANLLAIASTTQGARASALVQIAAVVYHPDSPLVSPILSLMDFHIPEGRSAEFHSLLQTRDEVLGFARGYVERGPIWFAAALWARHRNSQQLELAKDFSTCNGMLHVSPNALSVVESNWATMSQTWANAMGGVQLDQSPLISEEDFLFLEESIVRVWMHNLVMVNTLNSGPGCVFASDLTSGCPIARPVRDPVNWVRLVLNKSDAANVPGPDSGTPPHSGHPCHTYMPSY